MADSLTARQALEQWTAELDRELGWKTTVSSDGVWGFQTHSGMMVMVEAPAELDIVVFSASLGEIADLEDAGFLRGLLACNWYGMSTGPGQLGLEPGGNRLAYSMAWLEARTASVEAFASMLSRFTTIAAKLKECIDQGTIRETSSQSEPTRLEEFTRV